MLVCHVAEVTKFSLLLSNIAAFGNQNRRIMQLSVTSVGARVYGYSLTAQNCTNRSIGFGAAPWHRTR